MEAVLTNPLSVEDEIEPADRREMNFASVLQLNQRQVSSYRLISSGLETAPV